MHGQGSDLVACNIGFTVCAEPLQVFNIQHKSAELANLSVSCLNALAVLPLELHLCSCCNLYCCSVGLERHATPCQYKVPQLMCLLVLFTIQGIPKQLNLLLPDVMTMHQCLVYCSSHGACYILLGSRAAAPCDLGRCQSVRCKLVIMIMMTL